MTKRTDDPVEAPPMRRCEEYCGVEGTWEMVRVQLTPSMRSGEWQEPKWICGKCRVRLRGHFRFARD